MNIFSSALKFLISLTRPQPSRDWLIALVVIFALAVSLMSYGVYVFFGIDSGSAFAGGEPSQTPAITLTRGSVESVTEMYRTRAVNYAAHNFSAPAVVDPSK